MASEAAADRAIQELSAHGWCQGQLWDLQGRICLSVALVRAGIDTLDLVDGGPRDGRPFARVIRERFPERVRNCSGSRQAIEVFNDHPDTTLDDVVLVLGQAGLDGARPAV